MIVQSHFVAVCPMHMRSDTDGQCTPPFSEMKQSKTWVTVSAGQLFQLQQDTNMSGMCKGMEPFFSGRVVIDQISNG